ncbi:MAG: four helix bundle protein [Rhodanobacteraceae bacterium]|nr:four helix bundle protein [Rhodanobacteraceae bacterium]
MTVSHFRELDVWQLAMTLAKSAYEVAATFPSEERYGLRSQVQRSAVSVPSNIAEGNARGTTRDYCRFVSIAQGSCAELQTQLLLARDLGLGQIASLEQTLDLCDRVGQMLLRLNQSLLRRINGESRVPSPESR